MKIYLDHQQRLNLIALMGMQRGTVADIRMLWKLQDHLELNEEEKEAIGYQLISQNGQEAVRWDLRNPQPAKEFTLSDAECQRLRKIVNEYTDFQAADRRWIEPFLDQLPEETGTEVLAHTNG